MTPPVIVEVFRLFGVNFPADLQAIERLPYNQGVKALASLKDRVRKGYKHLAFELHPDRTGDDPVKTEQFKLLAQVRDQVEKMELQPPSQVKAMPPPPAVVVHRTQTVSFRHPFVTMNITSTIGAVPTRTAGGAYRPGGPGYVARMKPT